jgi:hypothetical protein
MFRPGLGRLGVWMLPMAAVLMTQSVGFAQGVTGQNCHSHCPPAYRHIVEGPPNIHFKHGCPKPICSPCTHERWGYYETCWRRWPWPPNWSHCPVPPPGAYFDGTLGAPTGHPGSLHMPNVAPQAPNGNSQLPLQRSSAPPRLNMDTPPGR